MACNGCALPLAFIISKTARFFLKKVLIYSTALSETFFILRRTERDKKCILVLM
jgi:hypothetical protein